MSGFTDIILNNKLTIFLGVALFAFVISTISLASSNNSKKNAIEQCEAQYSEATTVPLCSIEISALPANDPVYLKIDKDNKLKLWTFSGSKLSWDKTTGETALLCSGTGNFLEASNTQFTKKTCSKGTQFTIADKTYDAKTLKCKSAVTGDSSGGGQECGNYQGTLFNLGFNADTNGFVTYIETCINETRSTVLYTRHVLPGAAIKKSVSGNDGTWQQGAFFANSKIDMDSTFKTSSQEARFELLLGSKDQANKYLGQYLERGHMTPNGDGIFHTWRQASFFYENAVPQWKDVNGGNWANVEALARDIASHLQEDLIIIQGTQHVLTLPDASNKAVEITMHADGVEVPLWNWKIVKSEKLNAGIAFVTLNNPFETKLDNVEELCENICSETGWSNAQFTDFKKGYTYCCDPNSLVRMVRHSPDEGMVKTVLTKAMLPETSFGLAPSANIKVLLAALLVIIGKFMLTF